MSARQQQAVDAVVTDPAADPKVIEVLLRPTPEVSSSPGRQLRVVRYAFAAFSVAVLWGVFNWAVGAEGGTTDTPLGRDVSKLVTALNAVAAAAFALTTGITVALVTVEAVPRIRKVAHRRRIEAARPYFVRASELPAPAGALVIRATTAAAAITTSTALVHGLIERSTPERLQDRLWTIAQALAEHGWLTQDQPGPATTSLVTKAAGELRAEAGPILERAERQVEELEAFAADVAEVDALYPEWSQSKPPVDAADDDVMAQLHRTVNNTFQFAIQEAGRSGVRAMPPTDAAT